MTTKRIISILFGSATILMTVWVFVEFHTSGALENIEKAATDLSLIKVENTNDQDKLQYAAQMLSDVKTIFDTCFNGVCLFMLIYGLVTILPGKCSDSKSEA